MQGIAIARDGNVLTVGERDARRWMLATGEMAQRTERGPRDGRRWMGEALPDVERFVGWFEIENDRYAFRTWDLATGAFLGEVVPSDVLEERGVLGFDREGRRALLTTGNDGATPVVASVEDGSLLARLEGAFERAFFLSTGEIVSSNAAGAVLLFDANGLNPREIVGPRVAPEGSFEPGPMKVIGHATAGGAPVFAVQYGDELAIYDKSGALRFTKRDFWSPYAFSHDGERFAACASARVVVFDRNGEEVASFSSDAASFDYLALGRDARMLIAASSTGEILVRSTATSERPAAPRASVLPGEVGSLTSAPDSASIVVACNSGELLHWTLTDPAPTRLPGAGRTTASVWFLPDGRLTIATPSTLRIVAPNLRDLVGESVVSGPDIIRNAEGTLASCITSGMRATTFDTASGAVIRDLVLESDAPTAVPGGFIPFVWFALSPGGWIARYDSHARIDVWNPEGRFVHRQGPHVIAGAEPPLPMGWRALEFLSDRELLAGTHEVGTLLIDIAAGTSQSVCDELQGRLSALDVRRRRAAFAHVLEATGDHGFVVWDLDAKSRWQECPTGAESARANFLEDGSLVTWTPDRRIVVWEKP